MQEKPLKPSVVLSANTDLPADSPAEHRGIPLSRGAFGEKALGKPWQERRQAVPVGPSSEGDVTIESTDGRARTGQWDTSGTVTAHGGVGCHTRRLVRNRISDAGIRIYNFAVCGLGAYGLV